MQNICMHLGTSSFIWADVSRGALLCVMLAFVTAQHQ